MWGKFVVRFVSIVVNRVFNNGANGESFEQVEQQVWRPFRAVIDLEGLKVGSLGFPDRRNKISCRMGSERPVLYDVGCILIS